MELTQELVKELFEYKENGLYWKTPLNWKIKKGVKAGSLNSKGYVNIQINKKSYSEHRLVYLYHYGYLPEEVDHIDGNKNNNNIENLRPASRNENMRNTKNRKNNTSGHKGVSRATYRNKWIVQVSLDGNKRFTKSFDDFEFACLVADEARDLYHRGYARHG